MASPDRRPAVPAPQPQSIEPVSFPVLAKDGDISMSASIQEDKTLALGVQRGESVLLTGALTNDNRVRLAAALEPHSPGANHSPQGEANGEFSVQTTKREDGVQVLRVQREGKVLFDASISPTNVLRVVFDAATLRVEPAPETKRLTESAAEETREQEQPVTLRGRVATDIRQLPSPTGGEMALFQFAEHPHRSLLSYWNSQPEEERPPLKNNTVYRSVAAFDENIALLEKAEKGKEYDLTCVKRTWKEPTDGGREKTVNGFQLVGILPVTKRVRPQQEQQGTK